MSYFSVCVSVWIFASESVFVCMRACMCARVWAVKWAMVVSYDLTLYSILRGRIKGTAHHTLLN